MLYYMFPYYGSECLSNNKSHSSNKFLHKKIPKTNQGSSNAQQKYILKHRHTHTQEDADHIVIHPRLPGLSGEPRCSFGLPESSLSLSFTFFGHHDWTYRHVVVTAETVNTNTDNTQPLELSEGFKVL